MRPIALATTILFGCTQPQAAETDASVGPTKPLSCVPQIANGFVTYSGCVYGEEEQGPHLLGSIADGLAFSGRYLAVVPRSGHTFSVDGMTLRVDGVPLTSARTFQSAAWGTGALIVTPAGANGYLVQYQDATGAVSDYCDAMNYSPYAFPTKGYWTTDGVHHNGPQVTFGCVGDGKSVVCESWGYMPQLNDVPGDTMWDLNQACTQMARADYCADGTSHTHEKTPIWIRDAITGAEPDESAFPLPYAPDFPPDPPTPDKFVFEAAWEARSQVLCLSKLRWNEYPIGDLCNGNLKDPRLHQAPDALFCEELNPDPAPNLLFNGSQTMDMAQHRWQLSTGDTFTTVRGFEVDSASLRRTIPPKTPTQPPISYNASPLSSEGFLLRNPTGKLVPHQNIIEMYRQHDAAMTDWVVLPQSFLPDHTFDDANKDFEGWLITDKSAIKDDPTMTSKPVELYVYTNGTDYMTSTSSNAPSGYHPVGSGNPIGYVLDGRPL